MQNKWSIPKGLYEGFKIVSWNKEKVQKFFDFNNLNRKVIELKFEEVGKDGQKAFKCCYFCEVCKSYQNQSLVSIVSRNNNCPCCSKTLRKYAKPFRSHPKIKTIEDGQSLIDSKISGQYKVVKLERGSHSRLYLICLCLKCGERCRKWVSNVNLNQSLICNNCTIRTGAKIIEECFAIHGNSIKCLVELDKRYRSGTKFTTICTVCGNVNYDNYARNLINQKRSCGCESFSKGEKFVESYLNSKIISFESQKKFEYCRNINKLPFDFYAKCYNLIIEFHGKQHYEFIKYFHKEYESFEDSQKRDELKKKYAIENHITFLEIDGRFITNEKEINQFLHSYFYICNNLNTLNQF